MFSLRNGLALITTAAAVAVPWAMNGHRADDAANVTDGASYSSQQKEFYLTDEEKSFVRPGLTVDVEDVTINADLSVEVIVSFTDEMGMPLDRAGIMTPGPISMSFILAWYDGGLRQFTAYTVRDQTSPITNVTETQASSDSGGSWEDLETGRARYTYGTHLPADYDPSRTHSVAIYATRNMQDFLGKNYYSNPVYDFRPDGGAVTEVWDAIDDATCNSCHHDLGLHGGSRKSIKLCATCHNPQSVDPDTGNTVDLKVMIHKIHFGEDLPSVQDGIPYQIIGYRQSVHDYSEVVLPQDVRNCTNCHRPESPEGDIWMTRPTRAACASCHDNIDWVTGENHPAGPATSDDFCSTCHQPEGQVEFDASVKGAHTLPAKSSQLEGLEFEIVDVVDAVPGGYPTISFTVRDGNGIPVDIASMSRLRVYFAGEASDFDQYIREDAFEAEMVGDIAMYTFTEPIPADATGTWAFSMEGRRDVEIDGNGETISVRESGYNPMYYVALDGGAAAPRREVVNIDSCNVCHDQLAFHGGTRKNPILCTFCHSPSANDGEDRPEDEMPAESIHFKWMIHKLHAGTSLENGYNLGGSEGNDLDHITYPGQLQYCAACHDDDTYFVPVAEGALDTATTNVGFYFPVKPAASACLSCHDSVDAAAHAYTNTAPFGESCAACHGDSRDYSVEEVHAR